jgi:anti-sigma factor RsiW
MEEHGNWVRQIEAELEGELSLTERAALARHLTACPHCAGTRASHLELRAAAASAAGDPHARALVRPKPLSGRKLAGVVGAILLVGSVLGWAAHARWGGPGGGGDLEESRAAIVAH